LNGLEGYVHQLRHATKALVGIGLVFAWAGSLSSQAAPSRDAASPPSSQAPPSVPAPASTSARATFDKYCIVCHKEPRATAGLKLDTMDVKDRRSAKQRLLDQLEITIPTHLEWNAECRGDFVAS